MNQPRALNRKVSLGLLVSGGLLLGLCVVPSLYGRLGAPHVGTTTVVSGSFFLVSTTIATQCVVQPVVGESRTVVVPAGGRAVLLPGVHIAPWYTGAAHLDCEDNQVRLLTGTAALLGWFGRNEFPWVLIAAAALTIGWVYRPRN